MLVGTKAAGPQKSLLKAPTTSKIKQKKILKAAQNYSKIPKRSQNAEKYTIIVKSQAVLLSNQQCACHWHPISDDSAAAWIVLHFLYFIFIFAYSAVFSVACTFRPLYWSLVSHYRGKTHTQMTCNSKRLQNMIKAVKRALFVAGIQINVFIQSK